MTIKKIGLVLVCAAASGTGCASGDEQTWGEPSQIVSMMREGGGSCTVMQCIDVVANERLLYLSLEGRDCDGAVLWDFDLARQAPDGSFEPSQLAPMWGTSDANCIGKSQPMWHFHDVPRGTYRLCARFHRTLSSGEIALHARTAGDICTSHPFLGECSHCDPEDLGDFDPGDHAPPSVPSREAPAGQGMGG